MSFQLKRKESIPDGIRRVTCDQIDKALGALDGRRKTIGDEAIHDARKRFKQIRGVLRLVREELGDKDFDRENRTFRDAGRPLSEVRDAKVMPDTLADLVTHYKDKLKPRPFRQLTAALNARRREIRKRVLSRRGAAASLRKQVRKSSRRVDDWPLAHKGFKAIATGLRQTYCAARHSMRAALKDCDDDALHEWRKRTKDLRYEIELLQRAWPEALAPLAESLHRLTDLLGQDHDLAVLALIVNDELKDLNAEEERELLEPLIKQRRAELFKQARQLGRKLYAEHEDDFVQRMHGYWKAWKQ